MYQSPLSGCLIGETQILCCHFSSSSRARQCEHRSTGKFHRAFDEGRFQQLRLALVDRESDVQDCDRLLPQLNTFGLELRGDGDEIGHAPGQSVQLGSDQNIVLLAEVQGSLQLLPLWLLTRPAH